MNFFKISILLIAIIQLSGCVVAIKSKRANHHQQQQLALNSNELETLEADLGGGDVIFIGKSDATEITVKADIYSAPEDTNNFDLSLTKSGDTAKLYAHSFGTSGFWNGETPHINLVVYVPSHLALEVDDNSGNIVISDLENNIVIQDGSGSIKVDNVIGNVDIDDNSGDIKIAELTGSLKIEDGSGEIKITRVTGEVDLDDGSGDIWVANVGGQLTIEDSSGDIEISETASYNIIEAGSGDVSINKS